MPFKKIRHFSKTHLKSKNKRLQNTFFIKKYIPKIKKKQQNFRIIIRTSNIQIWHQYSKRFFFTYDQLPIKRNYYTFLKSSHKYSTAKRQLLQKTYIFSFICQSKQAKYLRFFLVFAPPGLEIMIKKIL
jgi:hypothetical protein